MPLCGVLAPCRRSSPGLWCACLTLLLTSPPWCACITQVEQSRFVVRPYSMGDAVDEPPETPRIAGSEEPTPRGVNRWGVLGQ